MRIASLVICILFIPILLKAQAPAPVMDSVTVLPDSSVRFSWQKPTGITVKKWVVYHFPQQAGTFPDTIYDPNRTSYIDFKPKVKPHERSEGYKMAYIFSLEGIDTLSLVNELHSTVFLQISRFDTCNASVNLKWTKYVGQLQLLVYTIYCKTDNNFQWQWLGQTSDTVFTHPIVFNQKYYYKITASANNFSSTSNIVAVFTQALATSAFNQSHAAVSNQGDVLLEFEFDSEADLSFAQLHRRSGTHDSIVSRQPATNSIFTFTDKQIGDDVFSYYLELLDQCNNPVSFSDTIKNVILNLSIETDNSNRIDWNKSFQNPDENFSLYYLTGNEETLIYTGSENYFRHLPDVSVSQFCYRVESTAIGKHTSKSEIKCITRQTQVLVQKAFTPNGDGLHDIFKPEIEFPGSSFLLVLYNPWGQKVFESTNYSIGWDGKFNHKPSPEGSYLYFLKYTTSNGEKIEQHGEISLIRP